MKSSDGSTSDQSEAIGLMPDYIDKLLKAFEAEGQKHENPSSPPSPAQPLIEPLSQRELEVLHLMAQGLSNQQSASDCFLPDNGERTQPEDLWQTPGPEAHEAVARARSSA